MEAIKKGGRPTTAERLEKINAFCMYRQQGKNQKETAFLMGITEKTATKYERVRLKQLQLSYDFIALLEEKAKEKATTPKDLVMLSKEIDRLRDKQSKIF